MAGNETNIPTLSLSHPSPEGGKMKKERDG
jgi:hypothetical protein